MPTRSRFTPRVYVGSLRPSSPRQVFRVSTHRESRYDPLRAKAKAGRQPGTPIARDVRRT
ncbi:MAG: hypothetical protein KJ057_00230 [Phycisphaerae bacterium]|nr:MAG: hypothetical protein F9K17_04590 [Phycisphaerae bacterium]MCL4716886.1 hypothetical protein [Phycisphaerae bacterium]NUQ08503.1 hypothetical protein [Phycisphaerae bacterium]